MIADHMDSRNLSSILEAKQAALDHHQDLTPIAAITALADMQQRPHPILNIVTGGQYVTLIGHVRLEEVYDPVTTALSFIRAGMDGVSVFTDTTIYTKGMDDLLMVSRGVRNNPVISQNYVLDKYHVLVARASGASGIVIHASILDYATLRETVILAQRLKMTVLIQINTPDALDAVSALSPHALCVGYDYWFDAERDLPLLDAVLAQKPYNLRVLPYGCISRLDALQEVVDRGVDAVTVDTSLMNTPDVLSRVHAITHGPNATA